MGEKELLADRWKGSNARGRNIASVGVKSAQT